MAGNLIIILLASFFAWAFAGVFGFIPYIMGIVYHFFSFLLDLIEFNLYPMGSLPRIVVGGSLIFLVVMFFVKLLIKNH